MKQAPFPDIGTMNASNDVTQILVYVNTVTDGLFAPLVLGAFFLIIMFSSYFAQIRFYGKEIIESSFAVAGFATFGLSLLMNMENGLLNSTYVFISLAIAIVGFLWVVLSTSD